MGRVRGVSPHRVTPSKHGSPIARSLEPVAASLWTLFVIVSVLVGAVWTLGIGDATLGACVTNPGLLTALLWLLERSDLLWLMLAAANVYLALAAREGLGTVRAWALLVLIAVLTLTWLSTRTGFPLGPIRYSARLGLKLGPMPIGLALLWFVVIFGARDALLRFLPKASHHRIAAGVGVIAALTDLALEPLAAGVRGFWFWLGPQAGAPPVFDAPLIGCLAWGVVAGLLALAFREQSVAAAAQKPSWKPAATLGMIYVVFLSAHLGRLVRG